VDDAIRRNIFVADGDYKLDESCTDDEIIRTIDYWFANARSYHDELLIWQQKSLLYYRGNQTDRDEVPAYNSPVVYNRIFEGTETLVPIITGSAQQFLSIPGNDSEVSVKNAKLTQDVLVRKYTDLDMQKKLEETARDMILKRYGVIEWGWDSEIDDINTWVVDPRMVLIPRLRRRANRLPYVMIVEEFDTKEELREAFPEAKIDQITQGKNILTSPNYYDRTSDEVYQILRTMTDTYWVWSQNGVVLRREKNPYWDFDGEEQFEYKPDKKGRLRKKNAGIKKYNHLKRPTKPLVFFTPFTTGEAPVSETSLAEVVIPIQDDINVQKRAITNNLRRMGNGQVYIDSDSLPQEIIDQITSEPGLVLVGKNLASENRIRRDPGVALPAAHFSNLAASLAAFDNIFGTHGSVRGESDSSTLGGQIINRQQDLSRIDQLTREVNRGMGELVNGLVQVMKMYYDEKKLIPIIGKDNTLELSYFSRENIDENMVVETKAGTPIQLDPVARSNRAIQLWQLNAMDGETLFEELGFPDPQAKAQALLAWRQGQLAEETNAAMELANVGAAAKAAATPEGGRKAETPNDSVSRAQMNNSGGGRAALPGNIKV
jgi:hypothetical protein